MSYEHLLCIREGKSGLCIPQSLSYRIATRKRSGFSPFRRIADMRAWSHSLSSWSLILRHFG